MIALNDDNFHIVISQIVEKSKNAESAIKEMMKLKYPNSKDYIEEAHAKAFYIKYKEINNAVNSKIKLNKDFTKNAYDENMKLKKVISKK